MSQSSETPANPRPDRSPASDPPPPASLHSTAGGSAFGAERLPGGAGRANALPRYVQLSELLIRDIAAGRLADGERLPPEREMAAALGIAVGTLRKALAVLTRKGLLERVQGSGNYVRHRAVTDSVYAFFRLELPEGGGLPSARVLSLAQLRKPADLPPFGTDTAAHRIRRLRYLDRVPVAMEEIWLDAGAAPELRAEALGDSLYHHYRRLLGLWITRAEDRLSLAPMPGWSDPLLAPSGAPAGYIERISWDQRGRSVEFSRTWFHADRARYVARIG